MIGDKSEQCNTCRDKYNEMWQDRRELLDTLISVVESYCEECEGEWGKCTDICDYVGKCNDIIKKNKEFYRGLY